MESSYRVVLKNIYKLKCSSTIVLQKPKLIETHEKINLQWRHLKFKTFSTTFVPGISVSLMEGGVHWTGMTLRKVNLPRHIMRSWKSLSFYWNPPFIIRSWSSKRVNRSTMSTSWWRRK